MIGSVPAKIVQICSIWNYTLNSCVPTFTHYFKGAQETELSLCHSMTLLTHSIPYEIYKGWDWSPRYVFQQSSGPEECLGPVLWTLNLTIGIGWLLGSMEARSILWEWRHGFILVTTLQNPRFNPGRHIRKFVRGVCTLKMLSPLKCELDTPLTTSRIFTSEAWNKCWFIGGPK